MYFKSEPNYSYKVLDFFKDKHGKDDMTSCMQSITLKIVYSSNTAVSQFPQVTKLNIVHCHTNEHVGKRYHKSFTVKHY